MPADIIPIKRVPRSDDGVQALLTKLLAVQGQRVTGVALASLSRTSSTQSTDIDCSGFSRIVAYFDVSSSPGAGTLSFRIIARNPITLGYGVLFAGSPISTTGLYSGSWGPGCSGVASGSLGFLGGGGIALPDIVRFHIIHSTADPYTYSLAYCLSP